MTTPNIEELIEDLRDLIDLHTHAYVTVNAAADLLQVQQELLSSQAERIKTLEAQDVQNEYNLEIASRKIEALRAQLAALEADYAETRDELQEANDSLASTYHILGERDAQLAAIAATEPSMIYHGRCVIDCGDSGHQDVTMLKMIARETKLFTRPMPAQDVTELVEALEYHIEQTRPIERSTIALSKYKGAK